jgi:hypothetical protein
MLLICRNIYRNGSWPILIDAEAGASVSWIARDLTL